MTESLKYKNKSFNGKIKMKKNIIQYYKSI